MGRHVASCQRIIKEAHRLNPAAFGFADKVYFEIVKVRPMKNKEEILADPNIMLDVPDYHLVGLRTDVNNTHVVGLAGDGNITYPYAW